MAIDTHLDVLHVLPVELFPTVVHALFLYKQLEQCDRLLGAININPGHVEVV